MKHISIILLSILTISFQACKKDTDPIAEINNKLSSGNTKIWKLNKLFINGSQQTLTPGQLAFSKTYNKSGNWSDSDGYSGTFKVETIKLLKETTTVGGTSTISYKINSITDNQLDVEYTFGQETYRFVYAQ